FSNFVKIEVPDLSADLWVEVADSVKSNTSSSVEMEYIVQYGNNGPDQAKGVLLSNLLPENGRYIEDPGAPMDSTVTTVEHLRYYRVPDLAPGESREVSINALVDTVAGDIMNISTISSASADNTLSNNSDTVSTNLDNIVITGITKDQLPFSDEFTLSQNYPNPFDDKTTIKFSIPSTTTVTIAVYDGYGRIVETLLKNSITPAGNYELEYFPRNIDAGLYYYAIEAEKYFGVKKMIVIK
ncbi:MAG: T9SS type A sorting domain-containing protein, partial [Cyclobacteriaceae bacterium]